MTNNQVITTTTTKTPAVASENKPMHPGFIVLIAVGSALLLGGGLFAGYVAKYGLPWKKRNSSLPNV
jgi:hypothetical protein